jgi:signal transduction histidine kinase
MGILLAFAPFVAFAVVDHLAGGIAGLIAGSTASAALILRGCVGTHSAPKLLELGTLVLFGGLTLYTVLSNTSWSVIGIRLSVDTGLMLVVLLSLLTGRPFTMQYAREQVPREFWNSREFIRANYIITAAWALAFIVMVAADSVLLFAREVPPSVGIIATVLALLGAARMTTWYPRHRRAVLAHAATTVRR